MELIEEDTVTTSFPDARNINSSLLPNYHIEHEYTSLLTSSEKPVELFQGYSDGLLMVASVSCILFMIVGVPGNLITIAALAKCKKVRNATAVFIINLSLSDLLFCCFNLPLATSTFLNRAWTHGDLLCRLFPLLRYGLVAVSLFTILAITINRYVMIGHPRIYPRIYQRKFLIVMVIGCWLFAFLPLIFTWTGHWGRFGLDLSIGSCSILHDKKGHSPKEFLFIIAFALPCLCIIICYARIFYIVRKTHESVIKSVGSMKIVQTNSTMKITVDEEQRLYDEKKSNDTIRGSQREVMDEKQLLPKTNDITSGDTSCSNNTNKMNKNLPKLSDKEYSVSDASSSSHYTENSRLGKLNKLSSHEDDISSNVSSFEGNLYKKNKENGNNYLRGGGGSGSGGSNSSSSFNAFRKDPSSDIIITSNNCHSRTNSLYDRQRKYLTKLGEDEDLKFIDTSIESDLPPTLSNLRYNNNNTENQNSNCILRKLSAQLSVKVNEMNNFTINVGATTVEQQNAIVHLHDDKLNEFDSAVEYSSSSTNNSLTEHNQVYKEIKEPNKLNASTQYLTVQVEPSSSSGIDIPYDQETIKSPRNTNGSKRQSFVRKFRKSTRLGTRKRSTGNTSGASIMYPGRMTPKDKKLLKMILVIFVSFVICYLPITINKTFESIAQNHFMNISGYLLIYLTTCINPIIYVVMSSEYRQAYKNLLMCRNGNLRQGKIEILRNASPRA